MINDTPEGRMQRDIEYMRSPNNWMHWPLLPLIKRNANVFTDPEAAAFMFDECKPKLYIGLIFMQGREGKSWSDILTDCKSKEYETFEALAAEYRVD